MHFSLFRTHSTYICSMFCFCCNLSWEKLFKMQESGSDLLKKGSQVRINKLCLSSHSVRRDRGRSLSGSCFRLWNPFQLRKIPDFLHGMGVSTFPTPGLQSHGASLSPHSHRKWGELWKSKGCTVSSCFHSIHRQNPDNYRDNLLMCQRGQEAVSTACAAPGCGGTWGPGQVTVRTW